MNERFQHGSGGSIIFPSAVNKEAPAMSRVMKTSMRGPSRAGSVSFLNGVLALADLRSIASFAGIIST